MKLLGISIEENNHENKNKKNVGKVIGKKFKSGSWKGKKGVGVFDEPFDESEEMKKYLEDHKVNDSVLLFIDDNVENGVIDTPIDVEECDVLLINDEKAVG